MPEPTHEPTTQDKQRHNKYARMIKGVQVDFYDVARAFGIVDPAIAHALKKLLRYGCGEKPLSKDVDEAIFSLERWKERDQEAENLERFHENTDKMLSDIREKQVQRPPHEFCGIDQKEPKQEPAPTVPAPRNNLQC